MAEALFEGAFPYQKDVLELPVKDIGAASEWYCHSFGMTEVARASAPLAQVVLERDGVRLGFAVTGADPSQDGAAILVSDIERAAAELTQAGVKIGNRRIDTRDDGRFDVFFVVAPDGLCYYFHQPLADDEAPSR